MNKYVNKDGSLKDKKITADIRNAADMYENGELIETQNVLIEIANAIQNFEG